MMMHRYLSVRFLRDQIRIGLPDVAAMGAGADDHLVFNTMPHLAGLATAESPADAVPVLRNVLRGLGRDDFADAVAAETLEPIASGVVPAIVMLLGAVWNSGVAEYADRNPLNAPRFVVEGVLRVEAAKGAPDADGIVIDAAGEHIATVDPDDIDAVLDRWGEGRAHALSVLWFAQTHGFRQHILGLPEPNTIRFNIDDLVRAISNADLSRPATLRSQRSKVLHTVRRLGSTRIPTPDGGWATPFSMYVRGHAVTLHLTPEATPHYWIDRRRNMSQIQRAQIRMLPEVTVLPIDALPRCVGTKHHAAFANFGQALMIEMADRSAELHRLGWIDVMDPSRGAYERIARHAPVPRKYYTIAVDFAVAFGPFERCVFTGRIRPTGHASRIILAYHDKGTVNKRKRAHHAAASRRGNR